MSTKNFKVLKPLTENTFRQLERFRVAYLQAISLFLVLNSSVFGQITVKRLSDIPRAVCANGPDRPNRAIQRYAVRYLTLNKLGNEIEASGLIAYQTEHIETLNPLLYLHPTSSRLGVPSMSSFESRFATCKLLTNGNILIAPDYVGMGASESAHGYMIKEEVNQAAIDFIMAIKKWFEGPKISSNLTLVGYSQGGHAALSIHQYLDQEPSSFVVGKTYAMSAPANLSVDMLDTLLYAPPSDNTTYLTVLVLANYQEYYGDVYRESPLTQEYLEAEPMAIRMDTKALQRLLPRNPRTALHEEFVANLEQNPNHPLRIRLKLNDIEPWSASAPIILTYSSGDKTVPASGTIRFSNQMKELGNNILVERTAINLSHASNFIRSISFLGNILHQKSH